MLSLTSTVRPPSDKVQSEGTASDKFDPLGDRLTAAISCSAVLTSCVPGASGDGEVMVGEVGGEGSMEGVRA